MKPKKHRDLRFRIKGGRDAHATPTLLSKYLFHKSLQILRVDFESRPQFQTAFHLPGSHPFDILRLTQDKHAQGCTLWCWSSACPVRNEIWILTASNKK